MNFPQLPYDVLNKIFEYVAQLKEHKWIMFVDYNGKMRYKLNKCCPYFIEELESICDNKYYYKPKYEMAKVIFTKNSNFIRELNVSMMSLFLCENLEANYHFIQMHHGDDVYSVMCNKNANFHTIHNCLVYLNGQLFGYLEHHYFASDGVRNIWIDTNINEIHP